MDNFEEIKEALRASEEKYRQLTTLMPVAVLTTDADGLITFYNEKAAELWGRSPRLNDPEETRFCGSWKLYYPDGTPMPHEECPTGMALKYKKKFRSEEISIERPDGKRISALVNIDLLIGNDGRLTGAINVFQDITERQRSLGDTMRLAAIVESSDDAIISKTLFGIITSWNRGAERIFGYKDYEIIGKPINVLIPLTMQHEETTILEKIRRGEKVEHFETIRITKDGRLINISLTVSPVRNEKDQIVGASKIARDITERVRKDNQLKVYSEKLKELNNHKDEFMAVASHELKTPLTVIKANIELLQLKLGESGSSEFVGRTMAQVNKLSTLISDLLDISRVQSGGLKLNFGSVDLNEMISEITREVQQTNPTHKIIFQVHGDTFPVMADSLRLEQVIFNMLINAVKYSPASDKVIVNAEYTRDQVMVSIRDFGMGISKGNRKEVFKKFFNINAASSKFLGSGIGLYISNKIIKRHGGKMWVDSEEGQGSTFYFRIPAVQPSLA